MTWSEKPTVEPADFREAFLEELERAREEYDRTPLPERFVLVMNPDAFAYWRCDDANKEIARSLLGTTFRLQGGSSCDDERQGKREDR